MPISKAFANNIITTYPLKAENVDGTTSIKALQSALLTQFNTILCSMRSVIATKASEQTPAHCASVSFFDTITQPAMQNITLKIPHKSHIYFPP